MICFVLGFGLVFCFVLVFFVYFCKQAVAFGEIIFSATMEWLLCKHCLQERPAIEDTNNSFEMYHHRKDDVWKCLSNLHYEQFTENQMWHMVS